MSEARFKLDLKQLANSALVHNLSEHLTQYEKQVKKLVHEFDLRSRDAREKSRVKLDRFANQIKRTRADLEKRVTGLLHLEGKRINEGLTNVLEYLKNVTQTETVVEKAAPLKRAASKLAVSAMAMKASVKTRGKKSTKKATRSTKRPVSKKSKASKSSASATA